MKQNLFFILTLFIYCSCTKTEDKEFATVTAQNETVVSTIGLTGRAESAQQISIIAPSDITVLQLVATNGMRVKKDELLCKLDPNAALEKIALENTKSEQLKAQLTTAKIRIEGLRKDLEKSKQLYASGAVSLEEKEKQEQEYAIQTAQMVAVEAEIKTNLENLKKLKNDAELLTMTAPFDGVVTYVWVTQDAFIPGSSVKNGDLLFKISSEGNMMIKTTLREQDVTHFSQGQKLTLTFPGVPGATAEGLVKLVDSSATLDKDSGIASFRLQIVFTPPQKIKPGMEVAINYVVEKKDNVVAIPKTAINIGGSQGMEVMTIIGDKKIKKIIKTGLIGDMNVEVTSGLNSGELVMANYEE